MEDTFLIKGVECKFSDKQPKAVEAFIKGEWRFCRNFKEAQHQIDLDKFETEKSNPPNIDIEEEFEKLIFAGKEGLELIKPKITQVESDIFERASSDLTEYCDFPVEISQGPVIVLPEEGLTITCIDEIPKDRTPEFRFDLECCLALAPNIPEGQVWKGNCLFNRHYGKDKTLNFSKTKEPFFAQVDSDLNKELQKCECGILFNSYETQDGLVSYEVPVDAITVPNGIGCLAPLLKFGGIPELSDIQMYLTSFNGIKGLLLSEEDSDNTYLQIVNNSAFKFFLNKYEGFNKGRIEYEDFFKAVRTYCTGALKDLENAFSSKVDVLLPTDPVIVSWKKSITDLQATLAKPEVYLNIVTAYNDLAMIKQNLWKLFKDSKTLKESSESEKYIKCNKASGLILV